MAKIEDYKAKDIMSEKLPSVEPNDTISNAIGIMKKHDLEDVPVVQDGDLVGIISDATFIEKRSLPFSTKVKHIMSNPPKVEDEDSLLKVSEMLLSSDYRGIPVTNQRDEYIGFITRDDITDIIPSLEELKKTTVKDFMTPSPATIEEHQKIGKARAMMKRYDVRVLPVVDTHGHLSGMVGIQDIINKVAQPISRQERGERTGERDSYKDIEVSSIMSEPPITTSPNSEIKSAASEMLEHNISTLPATDDGKIKGIITQFDLIEMLTSFRERDQVYVQITGLEERPEIYEQMYDIIQNYLQKVNKVLKPLVLNVHIVSHQTSGEQSKYSVRLRLSTDYGMFYAKKFDWNMMSALDQALESIRKKVFKDKEKKLDQRKHPKYQKLIS